MPTGASPIAHPSAPLLDVMETKCVDRSQTSTMRDDFMMIAGKKSWPDVPRTYRHTTPKQYYRAPDIELNKNGMGRLVDSDVEAPEQRYEVLIQSIMTRLKIYQPRGGPIQILRGVAAGILGATVVGCSYLHSRIHNIKPGHVMFYTTMQNQPRFVPAGLSLEHNPFHTDFELFSLTKDYINFKSHVHIIKVPPGYLGLSLFGGNARVLEPGRDQTVGVHVICDTQFEFKENVLATSSNISLGPLHFINIEAGYMCPVKLDQTSYFLFHGQHVLECANMTLDVLHTMNEPVVYNDLCHYVVRPGELGCVEVDGETKFIDKPSSLWYKSDYAQYMTPVPLKQEKVCYGPLTRIVVDDYRKALIRDRDGNLVVLPSGVHIVKQPEVHLTTTSGEWYHCRQQMNAITADPLDVKLCMTMTYQVVDPIAFFKAGQPGEVFSTIEEMAKSVMSEIIRHMRFEETLKRRFAPEEDDHDTMDQKHTGEPGEDAPAEVIRNQWKSLSTKFTENFKRILKRDFGVQMDDTVWGFQDFDLVDQKLQNQLSKAVMARSEARAERVRLHLTKDTVQVKKETAKIEADRLKYEQTLQAQTDKEVRLLQVTSQQEVENARVEAEHKRKVKQREIDIEDSKAKVDAEFYAIQRKADANAYAVRAKAAAESELAKQHPMHFELVRERIRADMFRGMNPKVFLGDPGQASLTEALGRLAGSIVDRH